MEYSNDVRFWKFWEKFYFIPLAVGINDIKNRLPSTWVNKSSKSRLTLIFSKNFQKPLFWQVFIFLLLKIRINQKNNKNEFNITKIERKNAMDV